VLRPAKVVVSTGGAERPRTAADAANETTSQPEASSPAEQAEAGSEEPSAE
jgi:hypothetical protein